MSDRMLIVAPCFSGEEPWELRDSSGRSHHLWMRDDNFQRSIDARRVLFRAGCILEFDADPSSESIERVRAFWDPVNPPVRRE